MKLKAKVEHLQADLNTAITKNQKAKTKIQKLKKKITEQSTIPVDKPSKASKVIKLKEKVKKLKAELVKVNASHMDLQIKIARMEGEVNKK